jgi:hypothetical protein
LLRDTRKVRIRLSALNHFHQIDARWHDLLDRPCPHRKSSAAALPLTQAQAQVLSELADSLVRIAKEVGANHEIVKLGGISLELHEERTEEILSIRKAGR